MYQRTPVLEYLYGVLRLLKSTIHKLTSHKTSGSCVTHKSQKLRELHNSMPLSELTKPFSLETSHLDFGSCCSASILLSQQLQQHCFWWVHVNEQSLFATFIGMDFSSLTLIINYLSFALILWFPTSPSLRQKHASALILIVSQCWIRQMYSITRLL